MPTPSQDQLLTLIDQIYAAAVDDTLWSGVLESLMQATNSRSGVIYVFNPKTNDARVLTDDHLNMKSLDAYRQYYVTIDPWQAYLLAHPPGEVFYSQQGISDSELVKSEFYNDFLKPQDIFHAMGGVVSVIDDQVYVLGVQRQQKAGSYEKDTHLLETLFPHIGRAFNISAKLERYKTTGQQNCSAMDQLAVGIMQLDQSLKVKQMNQCMREIVASGEVLDITTGYPRAIDYQENQKLKAILSTVAEHGRQDEIKPPLIMKLGSSGKGDVMTLFAKSMRRHAGYLRGIDDETGVILFVTGRKHKAIPGALLREVYGLSPMQAIVCEKIASGRTVKEVSEHLGITKETTKSHLKVIFQRTGVRRQAELVRKIATCCATLQYN